MDNASIWWLAAGLLVALELISGTFYLLMLALGLAAAALAAHTHSDLNTQIVLAAVVGLGAVLGLYLRRSYFAGARSDAHNSANDLDVGQPVQVFTEHLNNVQVEVVYRGTRWMAQAADGKALQAGPHRIVKVEGSRLLIEPA